MTKIQIDEKELRLLKRQAAKLEALEAGGVDNWDYYADALEDYRATIEREEKAEDYAHQICEILGSSAYEPSERGAGITFTVETEQKVSELILKIMSEKP